MPVDYSAFDQKPTLAQAFHETATRIKALFSISIKAKLVLGIYFLFFTGFFGITNMALLDAYFSNEGGNATMLLILLAVLNITALILIIWGIYSYGARAATMRLFANYNGFEFRPFFNTKSASGTLFKIRPYNVHSRNAVSGNFDGVNFALFDHRFAVGTARFRSVRIFTIMALNTGTSFPSTLAENQHGFLRKVQNFDRSNKITVSDVPENFNVYSKATSSNLISSVINKDVITNLSRTSLPVDIELQGKDVFFYLPGEMQNKDSVSCIFDAVTSIKK